MEGYPGQADDKRANKNFLYFSNQLRMQPDGYTIEEFQKHWWGKYGALEVGHSIISSLLVISCCLVAFFLLLFYSFIVLLYTPPLLLLFPSISLTLFFPPSLPLSLSPLPFPSLVYTVWSLLRSMDLPYSRTRSQSSSSTIAKMGS